MNSGQIDRHSDDRMDRCLRRRILLVTTLVVQAGSVVFGVATVWLGIRLISALPESG
jgi:hypothetical protein